MLQRQLGQFGPQVSALGLGCMGLSGGYGRPVSHGDALSQLHSAVEMGVSFFDTAEAYGPFTNEALLGQALAPVRDKVVIATKFGSQISRDGTLHAPQSRPDHIRGVVEASLTRLDTDHIDILYQDRFDPQVPIEEVAGTVQALIKEGKVRYFAMANSCPDIIRRAHQVQPLAAVQCEYSLWQRPEPQMLALVAELAIGLVACRPLGQGLLSGLLDQHSHFRRGDVRRDQPRFSRANLQQLAPTLARLHGVAERHRASCAQVALAWLLARYPALVPVPGSSNPQHLAENLAAARLVLPEAELALLDGLFAAEQSLPNEAMMAMA